MRFPIILNIRRKVMIGFILLVIVIGAFGSVSYQYLREVERKQRFVEVADDLRDSILEARRYEKNFLLYGSGDDLNENRRYTRLGIDLLDITIPEIRDFKGIKLIREIRTELGSYQLVMNGIAPGVGGIPGQSPADEQVREHGKALVDLSQNLVSFERQRILQIVESLKTQLLIFYGLIVLAGALFLPIILTKIVRPLRDVERTTHRIAEGDFRPVPVPDTRDETRRVVEGINRMIRELERRQDQLVQAGKLSSLGTFTSGIAHELNNPLNNISTSCQILIEEFDKSDTEFSHRMLDNIEHEVNRARDIVRGLLEFSRESEFCLVPTPLAGVVENAVRLISGHVPRGIEISQRIPADLSLALDPQRMQQVFLNLIQNAVHAIEPPGRIDIAANIDSASEQVLITVEDTGKGIPEEELGKIFDPFFTTKETGLGTGLGLSIVFGIVRKHGGSISVDSRDGDGAKFTISFPIEMMCGAEEEAR